MKKTFDYHFHKMKITNIISQKLFYIRIYLLELFFNKIAFLLHTFSTKLLLLKLPVFLNET